MGNFEHYDVVHGKIELSDIVFGIINTKYFQRLKKVRQVGLVYRERPKAIHTRYDHCIGVYHLTNKLLDYLQKNTPNLEIPEFYRCCVNVAGLLHDVGHGAFSHLWEEFNTNYHHEDNGCECIDEIFDSMKQKLSMDDEEHNFGINLIKALIKCEPNDLLKPIDDKYKFIFQIVNSHVDVDKWDYLKRDYCYTKSSLRRDVTVPLDFEIFFKRARVSANRQHIEYNIDDVRHIYDLIEMRSNFHIHIYRTAMVVSLEKLLVDMLNIAVKKQFRFHGKCLLDISSKDAEFMFLTDAEVLKFLKSIDDDEIKKMFQCWETNNIKQITKESMNGEVNGVRHFNVPIKIPRPGEKFQFHELRFYGNNGLLPQLERGFYEKIFFFQMN